MAWRRRGSPANTGVATRGTGHVSGYRQTLARVHPVIRVPGLAHLLLLGPALALAQLGVPQLQGEHCGGQHRRYQQQQQHPSHLVVLDEALAPGANVCAPALTRPVVEYLKKLSQLIFLQKNLSNDEGLVA